ncbi:MAG TPA: penicillin-binding transpeptidase domain-containing protein [Streptosporangiaceae bacterium]|jgi:hypothetical protein
MRSRRWAVLLTVLISMVLTADGCALLILDAEGRNVADTGRDGTGSGGTSPEQAAADYFAAWERSDMASMRRLVADPPADFAEQHEALAQELRVASVRIEPGAVVRQGDQARCDFTVTRELTAIGTWTYRSTLRLGLVRRRWLVEWSPATLHPGLTPGARLTLTETGKPGPRLTDRAGRALRQGTTAQPYLDELSTRFVKGGKGTPSWAIDLKSGSATRRLKTFPGRRVGQTRTTLDRGLQQAADKAVRSASEPAAIVAVRPSTGEILAVADKLGSERGAFLGRYPPGSSFKVVTAAALLADGMGAGSSVGCPGTAYVGQRTISNNEGAALGPTSLRNAFAESCNTTFAQLTADRLSGSRLAAMARSFGFEGPLTPGVPAARGGFPVPQGDAELAEAAFGQGRVLASPLTMALVAAAAASGTWRPPRMVAEKLIRRRGEHPQPPHAIPGAAALRSMMRAVVTSGTAAGSGLPPGVAGKTGTAEYGAGDRAHAWFIGFRGDLAFAAFVEGGGWGGKAAAPLAARFLRAA